MAAKKKTDGLLSAAEARRVMDEGVDVDAPKRGRGRPEKAPTEEITAALVTALKAGAFIETAVVFAGIPKSTFYVWLKRGRKEKSGPYRGFLDAIEKASAGAELGFLAIVGTAARRFWPAAAWMLERRWPQKYARRKVPEGSHPTGESSTS